MQQLSRRRWLGVLGTTATVGVAGCLGEQEPPAFLVTNTQVAGPVNSNGIRVLITVENEKPDRQSGTLEVTLGYPPSGDSWQQIDEISVSRGTTPRYRYVFEDVYEADNDVQEYVVEAEIRTGE